MDSPQPPSPSPPPPGTDGHARADTIPVRPDTRLPPDARLRLDERLRPDERLKSRSAIDALFRGGTAASEKAYPLRLVWRPRTGDAGGAPLRIGFVAPKRTFRRAHDRNHVKRRMREAFRLHKALAYAALGVGSDSDRPDGVSPDAHSAGAPAVDALAVDAMLLFTGRELPTQDQITRAWLKLLRRIATSPAPAAPSGRP